MMISRYGRVLLRLAEDESFDLPYDARKGSETMRVNSIEVTSTAYAAVRCFGRRYQRNGSLATVQTREYFTLADLATHAPAEIMAHVERERVAMISYENTEG